MLADWLGSFDLADNVLLGLRVTAGVVGAVVGWFLSNPIIRLGYRIFAGGPISGWAVPWLRLVSAIGLGIVAYLFVPLGGGGGLGWGPGVGGGPGKGKGDGGSVIKSANAKDQATSNGKAARDIVDIELLGGARYLGEGRFYLLRRQPPPRKLEEVEEFLKKNEERTEVHIILTDQSVGRHHEAVTRLRVLLDRLKIPTVETAE